jgi:hypothetical protein
MVRWWWSVGVKAFSGGEFRRWLGWLCAVVLVEVGVVVLLLLRSSAIVMEWWGVVGCGIVAVCGVGW